MRNRKFLKNKTFITILLILIIAVNIPILVTLIFTQSTLNSTRDTMNALVNTTVQTQIHSAQQAAFSRNHSEQLEILKNCSVLEKLGKADTLEYGKDLEEAEDALESVTPKNSQNGNITTYLYFPQSSYLISSSQIGDNSINNADPLIFSAIEQENGDSNISRVFLYDGSSEGGADHSIYTGTVCDGVIFIFDIALDAQAADSKPDRILALNLASGLKDVEMGYYDSFGNLRVTSGEPVLLKLYSYDSLGPDEDHSFTFTNNGKHYLCCYVFNEDNQTKFVLFCRDEIAEKISGNTLLIWLSAILLVMLTLAVAIFSIRKTYKPINTLIDRNALFLYIKGNRNNILESNVSGWLFDEKSSFVIAAVRLDEYQDDNKHYNEDELEKIIKEQLSKVGIEAKAVSDADYIYYVLKFSGTPDIVGTFKNVQKQYSYDISVYLSDVHESANELHRAYNEAKEVSYYYTVNEKAGIVADSSTTPRISSGHGIDFGLIRRLSDCITELSTEGAVKAFDDIIYEYSKASGESLQEGNAFFNLLVSSIAFAVYDIDFSDAAGKTAISKTIADIRACTTVTELRRELSTSLVALSKRTAETEYNRQRFDKIKQFVDDNYTDSNLDAGTIAEQYHMSASTITRLFKKYNNSGFLEYVHQLRVAKACTLLRETDLSVAEIASMVGYTNSATMNRAFKAYVNSTPIMVRKQR